MNRLLIFYYALKDPRAPWHAKLIAFVSIAYLLSPVDILPDVIPFAGYLDDAVIIPSLISIAVRLLPAGIRMSATRNAERHHNKLWWITIAVIVGLLALMAGLYYLGRAIVS